MDKRALLSGLIVSLLLVVTLAHADTPLAPADHSGNATKRRADFNYARPRNYTTLPETTEGWLKLCGFLAELPTGEEGRRALRAKSGPLASRIARSAATLCRLGAGP